MLVHYVDVLQLNLTILYTVRSISLSAQTDDTIDT